jgi:hypothetical protein
MKKPLLELLALLWKAAKVVVVRYLWQYLKKRLGWLAGGLALVVVALLALIALFVSAC